MGLDVILVDIGVVLSVAWVVWYFWLSTGEAQRVAPSRDGFQEALIEVKGGYSPDRLIVSAGTPVRLSFRRMETSSCSEVVEFPDFGISERLPEGQTVPITLENLTPGEYPFNCQMGMLRGRVVVVEE